MKELQANSTLSVHVSVATAACGKLTVKSALMEIVGIPRKLSSV